jgi:thiol:disulfide interchange protein DsbD
MGLTAKVLFFLAIFAIANPANSTEEYLDPESAFKFSAKMVDASTVEVKFVIADGYYMYRERFAFKADGAKLGEPLLPAGKVKFDDTFQKEVETYRKSVTIQLPVEADAPFKLNVSSQGCADKGLCYAPMDSSVSLSPNGGGLLAAITGAQSALHPAMRDTSGAKSDTAAPMSVVTSTQLETVADSEMGRIEKALKSGKLLTILPLFILLGLGLSFTPCVLPMVPILSFIIVGEGARVSRARGLLLSVAYALGMALVYTALGIFAGLLGEGLSASLQSPWILSTFAFLMVVMSLSMFGVYQLQVPAAIQTSLSRLSEKQSAGKLAGVFFMGAISALIVGPCVAAPLAGALIYISQTRDVFIGGSALFSMAVGMSIPLLLVGASAGSLLPRAGVWMESVKRAFGVLMLGLALWIVSPVLPGAVQMMGWAALGIGSGIYFLRAASHGFAWKVLGLAFALFGVIQLAGVVTGGRDALAPLAHLTGNQHHIEFKRVKSPMELDAAIAQAQGKSVMLDFYADWCVSCKEMEKLTFTDKRVQNKFSHMVLLQADVTANDSDDKALLKRFQLFGPPGIIFFDKQGREIRNSRVIGFQNADRFLDALNTASSF